MQSPLPLLVVAVALARVAQGGGGAETTSLTQPGVVLSFDDRFVSEWAAAMPLFEKEDSRP